MKWYSDAHLSKGKSVFLEQMKIFVEWLKNAEEGERSGDASKQELVWTSVFIRKSRNPTSNSTFYTFGI